MPPISFTTCSAVCIIRHLPKIRWICLKSMKFGRKSVDFLKSTEFGGKLRNSEALRTLPVCFSAASPYKRLQNVFHTYWVFQKMCRPQCYIDFKVVKFGIVATGPYINFGSSSLLRSSSLFYLSFFFEVIFIFGFIFIFEIVF